MMGVLMDAMSPWVDNRMDGLVGRAVDFNLELPAPPVEELPG
jgi:hypothetical protein